LAFVGKLEIEVLIAFLFLQPEAPKAAPAIEARPAPAFKKKSSVAVLAAFFIPSEMGLSVFSDGVSSGFLSVLLSSVFVVVPSL